jgi:nitrate reductase gamma subunit
LNIHTEEVTTNILDMLVLLGVMLLLDKRLVSLPLREQVVLEDKLLQLLLRPIIDKTT